MSLNLANMLISVKTPKIRNNGHSVNRFVYGETEFFKMGAMPSLVMSGNNIDYIQVTPDLRRAPPGRLIQCERRKLSDGEFLIG